ncbi:MAG: substrate-binding domain-containing protein, partial [Oscillibacter sp.]
MKKLLSIALMLGLALSLTACGEKAPAEAPAAPAAEPVELTVFAAASLTDSLDEIIASYKAVAPHVTITATYDSSGTLKTQIENGADCDLFLSASPKQMNQLDAACDAEKNPDKLDFIDSATRIKLLENKVTLAVPQGNPKGITGFDGLAELLKSGEVLLAMGNSDVPVGQYTQKILTFYGLDEAALATSGVLTYGS